MRLMDIRPAKRSDKWQPDAVKIRLMCPDIARQAEELIELGGEVSDWDVLVRVVDLAQQWKRDIQFYRLEKPAGGKVQAVVYNLETMKATLEIDVECRPLAPDDIGTVEVE